MLIKTHKIAKDYGGNRILEGITAQVNPGEKIGLVGKNGIGKTTLIKLLTGDLSPDEGYVEARNDITIGYLPQQPVFNSDDTLYGELKQVFQNIHALEEELIRLENKMSAETDTDKLDSIMNKYSKIRDEFESKGGYQIDRNIRSILKGLGFSEEEFVKPLNNFSGGEKTRALLAQKLLQKPDILILDEPTNYLDLDGLAWLEDYLTNYQNNFIIITHDRYFLENTVNVIWDLDEQGLTAYKGNYSSYLKQKQLLEEKQEKEYEKQQKYIKKTQDFIRKNIEGQKTKQAQSRRKQLEKINVISKPQKERSLNIKLDTNQSSGEETIDLDNIEIKIQNQRLFPPLACKIFRGDKVGIIGPNGSGKTSLIKIMAGYGFPDGGSVKYGTGVLLGYLDQEQELLTPEYTLIEELRTEKPLGKEEHIRNILGRFHFSADQMTDYVSNLSGGEQVRLKLAKLFMRKPNLLILDEPTNHLDIMGREALEDALLSFDGTLIVVSHDRYLLDKVANKIIYLSREEVDTFAGNYSEYMEKAQKLKDIKKEREKEEQNNEASKNTAKKANNTSTKTKSNKQRELQVDELMEQIDELEAKKQDLEASLSDPDLYKDGEKAKATNEAYQETLSLLEEKYMQLESLA